MFVVLVCQVGEVVAEVLAQSGKGVGVEALVGHGRCLCLTLGFDLACLMKMDLGLFTRGYSTWGWSETRENERERRGEVEGGA